MPETYGKRGEGHFHTDTGKEAHEDEGHNTSYAAMTA